MKQHMPELEFNIRITFVIDTLDCGGAQRSLTIMANHWAKKGSTVTLITLDDDSTPPFFGLDSRIRLVPLGIYRPSRKPLDAIGNNLKRIHALRRAICDSKSDVVISFLYFTNVLVLLATRGLDLPVIVLERNVELVNPIGRVWERLRRWTYPFGDQVVVENQGAQTLFPPKIQVKTTVIPNPVGPITITSETSQMDMLPKPSVVAIGKFSQYKGFDLLLKAFARIKDRYPDWSLTIFGDGPLHTQTELLRDELGLKDRVHLPGCVKNPHQVLRQAELFVMSSRWEAFPMSLADAMACGLPVIATDCHFGSREIVRHGIDGVLVPPEDAEALAAAMGWLMSDQSERNRLAASAVEVRERFGLEKVMDMWEELLRTVLHN